jgi:hypothetical protein
MLFALAIASPAMAAPTKAECNATHTHAQELRRSGRLFDTRAELARCSDVGCPAIVRSDCAKLMEELENAIPTIVFEAKDRQGHDVADVSVTSDGRVIAEHLDGTALPMDLGRHELRFKYADVEIVRTFILREGEKARHERIDLFHDATQRAETPPPPPPLVEVSHSSSLATAGWVIGGVGVASLVLGSVAGFVALSAKNDANCDTNGFCDAGALSSARTAATVSTIGFVAAGVFLVTGIIMLVAAPKHVDRRAALLRW